MRCTTRLGHSSWSLRAKLAFIAFLSLSDISSRDQLGNLPPAISYSGVQIPLASLDASSSSPESTSVTLLRRDLFDARFQLANEEDEDEDSVDVASSVQGSSTRVLNAQPSRKTTSDRFGQFSEKGGSDLIKGVYEGGLKTWECSLDLVVCKTQSNVA